MPSSSTSKTVSLPLDVAGARARLTDTIASVARNGADVLVRINRDAGESQEDLDAAVQPGVTALMLPKADSFEQVRALSADVARLEGCRDMTPGGIRFVPMIETAAGLLRAEQIAAADERNIALNFGAEDFAVDTGLVPDEETLLLPNQLTLYAARAAGLVPLGLLNTVAEYRHLDAYRALVRRSIRFGFEGASCIHPSLVPILNEEFSPRPARGRSSPANCRCLQPSAGRRHWRHQCGWHDGRRTSCPAGRSNLTSSGARR